MAEPGLRGFKDVRMNAINGLSRMNAKRQN
jgi:hypothetical protein